MRIFSVAGAFIIYVASRGCISEAAYNFAPYYAASNPTAWDQANHENIFEHRLGVVNLIQTSTNPWRTAYEIDYHGLPLFNPSIIVLPGRKLRDGVTRLFVVARRDKWVEPLLGQKTRQSFLYGCFLGHSVRDSRQRKPVLRCINSPRELNISVPREHLERRVNAGSTHWRNYCIGPEDPRLVWHSDGTPLIFFNHSCEMAECIRTMFILDLRVAFPMLNALVRTVPDVPAILYHERVEFYGPPSRVAELDKNYAMFFSDNGTMYAQVATLPRVVVWYSKFDVKASENLVPENLRSSHCLDQLTVSDAKPPENIYLNQGTNAVKVTLCHRGECIPSSANTLFLSIVHRRRYYPNHIEPFAVTWRTTAPYEYVSFSRRLEYLGIPGDTDFRFTTTLSFHEPGFRGHMDHGFLDSLILISVGLNDKTSHLVVTETENLMKEHFTCDIEK